MNDENIREARLTWGDNVVDDILEIVYISDPDGAWSLFNDMGMYDHVECIEFLYFE